MGAKHFTERDLRALSTGDLLNLIRQDIRELDQMISVHKHNAKGEVKQGKHKSAKAALAEVFAEEGEEEPEVLSLHAVTCCNHHMGDFPAMARVRCPFCNEWHRAGDFPRIN